MSELLITGGLLVLNVTAYMLVLSRDKTPHVLIPDQFSPSWQKPAPTPQTPHGPDSRTPRRSTIALRHVRLLDMFRLKRGPPPPEQHARTLRRSALTTFPLCHSPSNPLMRSKRRDPSESRRPLRPRRAPSGKPRSDSRMVEAPRMPSLRIDCAQTTSRRKQSDRSVRPGEVFRRLSVPRRPSQGERLLGRHELLRLREAGPLPSHLAGVCQHRQLGRNEWHRESWAFYRFESLTGGTRWASRPCCPTFAVGVHHDGRRCRHVACVRRNGW